MSTATLPYVNSQPGSYDYHAIAVAGRQASSKLRDNLRPGNYDIDTTARIRGVLTVKENSEYTRTVQPEFSELLAAVLSNFSKRTQKRILRNLPDRLRCRISQACYPDLAADCAVAISKCSHEVTASRRGAVGGSFTVSIV